jgi:hypothetical protein
VEKVIGRSPSVNITQFIELVSALTDHYIALGPGLYICIASDHILEKLTMCLDLDRFLIMEKYIVTFVDKITAVVEQILGPGVTEWVTEEHAHTRLMALEPRPKGVIVQLIYSNHV